MSESALALASLLRAALGDVGSLNCITLLSAPKGPTGASWSRAPAATLTCYPLDVSKRLARDPLGMEGRGRPVPPPQCAALTCRCEMPLGHLFSREQAGDVHSGTWQ